MLDVRGLRCPWPVVRLARALREGATIVTIVADDPAVAREIAAFADERGLDVRPVETSIGPGWQVNVVT